MKLAFGTWCTFLVLTIGSSPLRAEEGDPGLKFHIVVPTNAETLKLGREGFLSLEFRNAPFSQMGSSLRRCQQQGLLPAFDRKPPELYIYLPTQEMYREQRAYLAAEAQRQFQELYPNVDLKIKFRVVRTNINVTYFYSRMKEMIQAMKQKSGNDPEIRDYVSILESANEEAFKKTVSKFEVTAPAARKFKYSIAGTRLMIVSATRLMQMLPAFAHGGTPLTAALALVVADGSAEGFIVAYTQAIQRYFASWPFRLYSVEALTRLTSPRILAEISRFINSALWNLSLLSVGRPTIMQALAHTADPNVPAPSLDSVENVAEVSGVGALFYALFTNGYNTLRDKGWVTTAQIDVVLQIAGVFDLATGIINSNPNWYFYRLFTLVPQWSFYALVGILARLASPRADRVFVVESSIQKWIDVHGEQHADDSEHIADDADFNRVLERIRARTGLASIPCEESLRKTGEP